MRAVLAVLGWGITVAAAIIVGTWEPSATLYAAALAGLAAVVGFALWQSYRASSRAGTVSSIIFYGWLYAVPFLLGVGLVRRMITLPELLSFGEAQAYASRTDSYLWLGLLLNGLLPVVGLVVAGTVDRSRLRTFGWAALWASLIFLAIWFVGHQSNAGLFGHLPRWEKP